MNDSTKKIVFTVLVGLPSMLVVWVFGLYFFGCGLSNSCMGIPQPDRTPIPTLVAATMPAPKVGAQAVSFVPKCHISAVNLIGAWVTGGFKETDPFTFTDLKGTTCTANFKDDVQQLFVTPNLWYDGAPACTTCHYADVAKATQNMDLSSYAGILAGAHRVNGAPKGDDILGGGNWDKAVLHQMLYAPNGQTQIGRPAMPLGRPASVPAEGPVLSVGLPSGSAGASTPAAGSTPSGGGSPTATPATSATETSTAGTGTPEATATGAPAIARPSNPGGPGKAVDLQGNAATGAAIFKANCVACHADAGIGGVANPGSTDGTVPSLNPIDPTLIDQDPKTYATNIDLFLEHGSTPNGTSPSLKMPAWGDNKNLTPQQIADVIAYVISLNPANPAPSADVARPSNPGGPGPAVSLNGDATAGEGIFNQNCVACHASKGTGGIANPGSNDGSVPALNPIDPTIANKDPKVFATNVDLFVEHGSTPEGPSPSLKMPAWGDNKNLTPQQIADVIAYVISLNSGGSPAATPVPDIARPSNPGGAGVAITLQGDATSGEQVFNQNCLACHGAKGAGGVSNPGSNDGSVPALNPIDDTIKNTNPFIFAFNVDLFIEHGSTPEGPSPSLKMPAWGDNKNLTPQQIADVIAYLIGLNK